MGKRLNDKWVNKHGWKIIIITWVILAIGLLSMGLASASTGKIGETFNVTISCSSFNCASGTITVLNPNSSILVDNQSLTDGGSYASYQITPQTFGQYSYYALDDAGNISSGNFVVTSTGVELTTGTSIVYVALMALFIVFFAGIAVAIGFLPGSNQKDEEGKILSITWLKYLRAPLYFFLWMLFIAITFLASNLAFAYLGETLFANLLFNIFRISFAITPLVVIVWGIFYFVKFFHDRQFQNLLNRGFYPQEQKRL